MYFLGQAGNYKAKDILRHTFAFGTKSDLKELRAYLAAHYGTTKDRVALYHTGRSALAVALKNLVPLESEVIITSPTCFAVVQAVREADCTPIYADIDLETLHFGKKELETALAFHPDAKAVIVQNNLGNPCDIKGIEKVCKKYGLILIEDLAHSAGIHYKDGREAGTVGSAAVLSFGKGKAVDTISGGAVIFTDPESAPVKQPEKRPRLSNSLRDRWYPFLGATIRGFYHLGSLGRYWTSLLLKLHFIERSADAPLDTHTRLTCWQAKLALRQIRAFPRAGRRPIREHYFVDDRDDLLEKLEKAGYVFNDIWYDCPVSPRRYYKKSRFKKNECPVAYEAAKTLINLPTWYSEKALKPARKLIERYEVELEFEEEDTPAPEPPEPVAKSEPTARPQPAPVVKPRAISSEPKNDLELLLSDPDLLAGEENPEPEEPPAPDEAIAETSDEAPTAPVEYRGNINYSELTYDRFDNSHLNRTNIIDTSINSDGTVSALTKEERAGPPIPVKNNLPKMRQYRRPSPKAPEQTEGKVW